MAAKMLRVFCFIVLIHFVSVNCEKLAKRIADEDESTTNDDSTRVKKVNSVFLIYSFNIIA